VASKKESFTSTDAGLWKTKKVKHGSFPEKSSGEEWFNRILIFFNLDFIGQLN